MGVQQYIRKVSVIVGSDGGAGLEFGDFKLEFQVRRGDIQTPNSADLRIYNLNDETRRQLAETREFTQIAIQAGYEGNFGLIFRGAIKQVRSGRVDQLNSYVDITAADGDEAYNYSTIAVPMAAGTKPADAINKFLETMAPHGITKGYVPELKSDGPVRPMVCYGSVRDELRNFALNNDCTWSIQDGQLMLIPQTGYVAGNIPVISPNTGLIGVPEQTENGLEMQVLLNPTLRIGQAIKLDSAINKYRFGLDLGSQADSSFGQTAQAKLNADGLYYVMYADHIGDTRGQNWYTQLVCLAVDAEVPMSSLKFSVVQPDASAIRRN